MLGETQRKINIDELLGEYIKLKSQEKAIKESIKSIQDDFSEYFIGNAIDNYSNSKYSLTKQERKTISYSDTIKELLKSRGIYEAVVTVDKAKLGRMVKANIVTTEELHPFEEVKASFAWVVEEVM